MSALCECGCGEQTPLATRTDKKLGHVQGEPLRFSNPGHAPRAAAQRRIPKFQEDPSTGCWVVQTCVKSNGYAKLRRGGREVLAHRWLYEQVVGTIPEGLELDHLCRNRRCINPNHLEPVTHTENCRRGVASRGVMNAEWAAEIRESQESATKCAERYGVTPHTVCAIRRGKTWAA